MIYSYFDLNESIFYLIEKIIKTYFSNVFAVCILFHQSKDDLIFFKPFHWNATSFIVLNHMENFSRQNLMDSFNIGCQSFIVTSSMVLYFLNQHRFVQDQSVQRNAIKFLFVLSQLNESSVENFNDILQHPALERILNTLIMKPEQDYFHLLTNKVAGHTKQYILMDKYFPSNKSFHKNANLFPQKWLNLEQKPLSLIFFDFPPYNIWNIVEENTGFATEIGSNKSLNVELGGTEGLLLRDFMDKYNFSLKVSLGNIWGKIEETEDGIVGSGVMGSIFKHDYDFALAAILPWYPDCLYIAFSHAIRKSSISCLVPRPKPLDLYKVLYLPFSKNLWVASFITILLGIISIQFIKKYTYKLLHNSKYEESSSHAIITVLGIILMQGVLIKSKEISTLLIFATLLIFGLIIGSAYSGGLASVMNSPHYEKPISTIDDLIESGISWGAEEDAWIQAISDDENPKYKSLVERFQVLDYEVLESKISQYNFAYPLETLQYGSYAVGNYINDDTIKYVQRMNEDFYWAYTVAGSPKDWPLMPLLNDVILKLSAVGIQSKYETITQIKYLDETLQTAIKDSRQRINPGISKLTLNHLSGAFFLYFSGIILAIIYFLGEVFSNKIKLNQKI